MLMNVLARAVDTVGDIIKNPIGFLGNLVEGVKGGILKFKDNILDHLRKGLMSGCSARWPRPGSSCPRPWTSRASSSCWSSIFGLTWTNIRNRIVKKSARRPMVATEKGVEIFQTLASEGIAGLWNMLVEKLGDIKEMILAQVKELVITKIITAGITWLIGLLNPAAAFIKACKLIYDVMMFFWTTGSRSWNSSTPSSTRRRDLRGNIGRRPRRSRTRSARGIPITIGFLAGLLGLGEIGETIKAIIDKIQEPVHAAVKWIITKAVALVKAVGKLLGFGKDGKEKGEHGGDPEKQAKIALALDELDKRDAEADTGEGVDRDRRDYRRHHPGEPPCSYQHHR